MKVLILYDKGDKKSLSSIQKALGQRHVSSQSLVMAGTNKDSAGFKALEGALRSSGALILLPKKEWKSSPSFAYTLGYAAGKEKALYALIDETDQALAKVLKAHGIKSWGDGEKLAALCAKRKGEREAKERVEKARMGLFKLGVPCTIESFRSMVERGNTKCVNLFFKAGFSPDLQDQHGVTMLCAACREGQAPMVELLLKKGADINKFSLDRSSTPVIDAAMVKQHEILTMLIERGADVNHKSKDGQSALVISVGLDDTEAVKLLLKAGADPDDPDALGASARKYAALFNHPAMMEVFNKYAR